MTKNEILLLKKAGDLFPNNLNDCKNEYKKLVKIWHPDRNTTEDTNEVFAKITQLYNSALNLIKMNQWEKSNYIQITTLTGIKVGINFFEKYEFELGTTYICKKYVIYKFYEKNKYYHNAIESINKLSYHDAKMKESISRMMPEILKMFTSTEGDHYIVIKKPEDVYPLKNLLQYFNNEIPDKHVAWILSRLYNIACFLKYNKMVHNGITVNNCYVCTDMHNIILIGGWWYSTKNDMKMLGTTKDIYNIMSVVTKSNKNSNPLTDLESIKLIGRTLLGESNCRKLALKSNVPKAFINFMISGSDKNSYNELTLWEKCLTESYGERKFIKLDVSEKDIY